MEAKLSTANPKDWFVHWRDETGRQHRKRGNINRIKTLKEKRAYGKALCDKINTELRSGIRRPGAIATLEDIVETKKNLLRRRSWQSYKYAVASFGKWLDNPGLKMEEITKDHAREYLAHLSKQGQKGKSINGMRGFLTALFNHYAEQNEGYVNPFKGSKKYRQEIGKNIAFTDLQRERLWDAMSPGLRLFTRFIYFTYIRPVELLRLRVGDIRIETKQIIVHGHQSKNSRQQSVVIPDVFIDELRAMCYDQMPQDWYLFGRRQEMRPGRLPLNRNWVSKIHSEVLESLKFNNPDLTLYSWKHTGVVAAYKAGIDIYSIMRQLRHHSLDMTQIYLKSMGLEENEEFGKRMV